MDDLNKEVAAGGFEKAKISGNRRVNLKICVMIFSECSAGVTNECNTK